MITKLKQKKISPKVPMIVPYMCENLGNFKIDFGQNELSALIN